MIKRESRRESGEKHERDQNLHQNNENDRSHTQIKQTIKSVIRVTNGFNNEALSSVVIPNHIRNIAGPASI